MDLKKTNKINKLVRKREKAQITTPGMKRRLSLQILQIFKRQYEDTKHLMPINLKFYIKSTNT